MKKIIDGRTYDTATAALIAERCHPGDPADGAWLYQTRHGAFFLYVQYYASPEYDMGQKITPLTEDEAQKWLEENANHLVEEHFGPFPEAGAAERRLTLRIPGNLAHRLEKAAQAKGVPLNRYMMRCLERCVSEDGQPTIIS
jgi:predicted HicB family RNase H-like nuclease